MVSEPGIRPRLLLPVSRPPDTTSRNGNCYTISSRKQQLRLLWPRLPLRLECSNICTISSWENERQCQSREMICDCWDIGSGLSLPGRCSAPGPRGSMWWRGWPLLLLLFSWSYRYSQSKKVFPIFIPWHWLVWGLPLPDIFTFSDCLMSGHYQCCFSPVLFQTISCTALGWCRPCARQFLICRRGNWAWCSWYYPSRPCIQCAGKYRSGRGICLGNICWRKRHTCFPISWHRSPSSLQTKFK